MEQLAYSSIPAWARPGDGAGTNEAPLTEASILPAPTAGLGRSHLLVGVGRDAADAVADWSAQLVAQGLTVEEIVTETVAEADVQLRAAFDAATVGIRLMLAGPVGVCLALRATAVRAGLDDDELAVMPCGTGPIDVRCAHCGEVTSVIAAVDDVVECTTCARNLLVYYHVSRRTGHYLGFMIDAETANISAAQPNSPEPEREGVG